MGVLEYPVSPKRSHHHGNTLPFLSTRDINGVDIHNKRYNPGIGEHVHKQGGDQKTCFEPCRKVLGADQKSISQHTGGNYAEDSWFSSEPGANETNRAE